MNSCWTLHIKTLGPGLSDFSIQVDPGAADMAQLCDQIRTVTGLERNEQRLIYRGRLLPIATETECKVSLQEAVHGLSDGHTIHLVRRMETTATTSADSASEAETSSSSSPTASPSRNSPAWTAALPSRGRVPFRLRAEDLERPDPGSLESVRQGLMTLRTMQQEGRRKFYLGQWIDVRDTVNQWLEATIVDIVEPQQILLRTNGGSSVAQAQQQRSFPTYDPAVASTDLQGRRLLLLESCEESESIEQMDGIYYRPRPNNTQVQLLHIHYNGWPVRWDEWIRSDSERIRGFRVRTRHNTSQRNSSPTVQASMVRPPDTKLTSSEASDREAILPEVVCALESVQSLLREAASSQHAPVRQQQEHLPWRETDVHQQQPTVSRRARQHQLETLAPLLDRLGRTLTDSAPHVAALAASLKEPEPEEESHQLETIEEHPSTLGGLLSLLSRDRRPRTTNGQSVSSSAVAVQQPNDIVSVSAASSTTGGLEHDEEEGEEDEYSAVDPDLTDYRSGLVNTTRGEVRNGPRSVGRAGSVDGASNLLGAYLAAASLAGGGGTDGGTEEGLGRLLGDRGTGGIDIHIHAVVTGPGLEGGIGVTTGTAGTLSDLLSAASTTASPPRNRRGNQPATSSPAAAPFVTPTRVTELTTGDDDDDGIFSDLYTENPAPIDPATPPRVQREDAAPEAAASVAAQSDQDDDANARRTGTNRSSRRANGVFRFFRRGLDD